jgi:endonuclease/exonuclease/phosphatase family metal-dependent hydrolase
MREIITGNFAPFRLVLWPPSSLRIVDWNIDRGQQLTGVIDFLAHTSADMFILQEVDLNAKRTHRLNVAEEIARKLQMNYVFGREFQELVQGSKNDPAYHGQAIVAKWPIANPRLIRFSRQSSFWKPHWYLPRMEPFQERLGGRVALVAEVNLAGNQVTVYNLHLESKGDDDLRLAQIQEVLSDAANQGPRRPGYRCRRPESRRIERQRRLGFCRSRISECTFRVRNAYPTFTSIARTGTLH